MGTQLCAKGDECLAGVADGSIDIYISTSGGAAGLFPYIQVLDLPYLMSDDRVAEEVLTGTDFTATLRTMALADSGDKIRLMTIGNTGGWRNYANTQRRIAAPADLAGLKMRTVPADLPQTLATTLGASPTPIPWPELFTSLQTGVIDGAENNPPSFFTANHHTTGAKFYSQTNHLIIPEILVMSKVAWDRLTPADQTLVKRLAREAIDKAAEGQKQER
jgi:TRAP-type C4-dicarboxylate transport system substrate-binding protein